MNINPFNLLGFGFILFFLLVFLVLYPIFKVQDIRAKRKQRNPSVTDEP